MMIPMKNRTPRARRVAPLCLRPCVLAVLSLMSAQAAQAQALAAPVLLAQNARMPSLQETVVTATRTEQPLADLVADVSIVDRETIESSGATGLADVLARLPGIEISRNGGLGNASSVFLRGAESRFTAVYIDGVRIDSQSTGGAQWEQIPLSQIDRIEVLRGPAAAVYGSDAIGGVIQPGSDMVEIVPLDDTLLVEAKIRPQDIAFLHPGQEAVVKFTAYDYTIYGGLKAKLERIGADTITDEDKKTTYYMITLRTDRSHLGTDEKPLIIIPGMVASVDIITGKKTILSYLLKPIIKARAESLQER